MSYPGPEWCACPAHPRGHHNSAVTKTECERLTWVLGFDLAVVRAEHQAQDAPIRAVPVDLREFA